MVKVIGCLHEMDERAWPRCSHSGRAPDARLPYHIPASAAWLLLLTPRPALDGEKGEKRVPLHAHVPVIDGDSTMSPTTKCKSEHDIRIPVLSAISIPT